MPTASAIRFNSRKQPPTVFTWADTSAGLNLSAEGIDLGAKHVADCLNVDWLPGGGWKQRGALSAISTDAMPSDPTKMVLFTRQDGQSFLTVFGKGWGRTMSAPNQASVSLFTEGSGEYEALEVNYRLYFTDMDHGVHFWDGTNAIATLTDTLSTGDYTSYSPSSGNMPKCKFLAVWHGRVWALHTKESSTVHGCRVRSSVPLKNGTGDQAFITTEYNDLDLGSNGGNITGCSTAGGGFYIFKAHHTYQVTGWDWDTNGSNLFTFSPMDVKRGAVSNRAVASHGNEVYFWDARAGACRITENPNTMSRDMYVESIMFPIVRYLDEKLIPDSRMGEVSVGVVGDRVCFTVPWSDGSSRTLVYDVVLKTWTVYDYAMHCYGDFRPTSGLAYYVGVDRHAGHVVSLGRDDLDRDQFSPTETADIESFVVSPWMHGDAPPVNKLWSCMELIGDSQGSFDVTTYRNWDRDEASSVSNRTLGSSGPVDHGGVAGMKIPGRPVAKAVSWRIAAAGPSPYRRYRIYGVNVKFETSERSC